jgi:3-oxoacyl-[acyl-carrier protein] reductase
MKLSGRIALVTGAGRNLGRATALALAREGATVVVNGLTDNAALEAVAAEITQSGGKALPIQADVSDFLQVERLVGRAREELGTVDVLVSNAAIRPHGPLTDFTAEQWRRVMAVDLDATFFLAKAIIPGMLEHGRGSIIAISGLAAFGIRTGATAVGTAKAGLIGMMRGIARDYAGVGIRANTVVPGNMATSRWDQRAYLEGTTPQLVGTVADLADKSVPIGRLGRPEEVAAACVYLASDDAAYTTGQTIHVGGGMYMA